MTANPGSLPFNPGFATVHAELTQTVADGVYLSVKVDKFIVID